MAKCITNGKIVKRVSDSEARKLVNEENWKYCQKDDYRKFKMENGKK